MAHPQADIRPASRPVPDLSQVPAHAVAVIGMAGRFPDAPDLRTFWQNLTNGVESLTPLTDEQLRAAGVPDELIANSGYVKKATPFDRADEFDAAFFGFNAREAEVLDPQQRVLLECAWNAMEDAGYVGEQYPGPVSVFAGASINTYMLSNLLGNPAALETVGPYQVMLSNDKDFLATRVSYKLNLRGPGITIQTACSTSLVAVQLAWQSLLDHQCDLALAGGVSISFPQNAGYLYQEGMIFSSDGHCRPFDARGEGIRGGSGAGVVVLKRLRDAIADGDAIRAVILGVAINNDGSDKMGYTAPSVDGQAEVIAMAQARANVDADTISYIEAHGTATPLGDPIEISALSQAFRASTSRTQFCAIGSVKSNIGHLDAAAGVAGLIKTVLSLEHHQLPPSLNFETPNPQIDFAASPFYVNQTLASWGSENHQPRRAGVSSFGIGGTNAHAVLEEAPPRTRSVVDRPKQLLVLSARTAAALDTATENLAAHLEAHPDLDLADVAYTLQVGRKRFEYRRAVVCETIAEAITALRRAITRNDRVHASDTETSSVALLFSGQGSQYAGMGRTLYNVEPTFRETLDDCAERLWPWLQQDIRELILTPAPGDGESELNQTQFAQPALFAIEYALARTLIAWGVTPSAMLGHSIGEYVAACIAGVLSLDDALRLVAERGRLMQSMPAGRMLVVPLSEAEVITLLESDSAHELSLAAINAPRLCVVAGPSDAIARFEQLLVAQGVESRPLHTSHAFHSAMMEPVLPGFEQAVQNVQLGTPTIPYLSNLTGTWADTNDIAQPEYWSRHLRGTVRFADGVRALIQTPGIVLVEVGPGKALSMLARQTIGASGHEVLNVLPHPLDEQSDVDTIMYTLGRLWLAGANINWAVVHREERLQRVPLPTYPFERERYLIEPQPRDTIVTATSGNAVLQRHTDIADWFYVPSWKRIPGALDSLRDIPASANLAWLVFADAAGVGMRIVERLRAAGHRCLVVEPGEEYAVTDDRYTIRPAVREDYQQVVSHIGTSRGLTLRYVVHLWNLTASASASLDTALEAGYFSVIHTAQAIGTTDLSEPLAFTIVSNGTHRVVGNEPLYPEKSLAVGPSQVIGQEMPLVRCRSVDVVLGEMSDDHIEQLLADVIDDASADPGRPVIVPPCAYRAGFRWAETVERLPIAPQRQAGIRLRDRGVYLITGGLGGLGLVVARFLAETRSARLVLTSRSGLPNRSEWAEWLATHESGDATSSRIHAIQDLESLGAEVLVVHADASDRGAMEQGIALARQRFGAIHGVFHVAGLPGGSLLALHSRERAREVLAPKVEGTLVLESVFADTTLDFLVLFSSLNSMLGIPGGSDYSAANRFLDTYAQARMSVSGADASTPVIAIDWDAWRDVGMANAAANTFARGDTDVLHAAITPDEGIEALRRVLSTPLPQIAVITRDFSSLLTRTRTSTMLDAAGNASGDRTATPAFSQHARPDLAQHFVEPRDDRERFIATIWQDLLGLDRVGIDDDFFALGGHSLIATGMFTRIQEKFHVKLPLRTIFEVPTVRQLSDRVATLAWITQEPVPASVDTDKDDTNREEFEI